MLGLEAPRDVTDKRKRKLLLNHDSNLLLTLLLEIYMREAYITYLL